MNQDLNRNLYNMKQEFCPHSNHGEFSLYYYHIVEPSYSFYVASELIINNFLLLAIWQAATVFTQYSTYTL